METLDLNEAATFLKMNPEVLRRKAVTLLSALAG